MHWTNLPDTNHHPGFNNYPINRYVKPTSTVPSHSNSHSRFPPINTRYSSTHSIKNNKKKPRKKGGMLGSSLIPMMMAMQQFRQKPKQDDEFAFEVAKIMEHQETMLRKLQREKMGNGPDQVLLKKLSQLERKIEEAT